MRQHQTKMYQVMACWWQHTASCTWQRSGANWYTNDKWNHRSARSQCISGTACDSVPKVWNSAASSKEAVWFLLEHDARPHASTGWRYMVKPSGKGNGATFCNVTCFNCLHHACRTKCSAPSAIVISPHCTRMQRHWGAFSFSSKRSSSVFRALESTREVTPIAGRKEKGGGDTTN